MKRKCKGCGIDISHKHPNAKFHSPKCKDKYWNWENPRGKFAHLNDVKTESPLRWTDKDHCQALDYDERGWDDHKGSFR